jgi:hypothetical protein
MLPQTRRRACVTWPCWEDPNFDPTTANCRWVPLGEFSSAGAVVILPKRPQVDTLVTVQFKDRPAGAEPFLARMTATQLVPEGGWLTHCAFVAPIPDEELHHLLNEAAA